MPSAALKVLKIVGGVFLFVGLMMLGGAGWAGYHQYAIVKHWPIVDAVVTQSRLTSHQSTSTDSDNRTSTTTQYSVEIEFRYTADGREYTTPTKTSYSTNVYSVMKKKADEYAPGTHHAIHYNPENPNAVEFDVGLNFGFLFLPILLGFMGIVFSGVGGGLLAAARKARAIICSSCGQAIPKGQEFCPKCGNPIPIQ
ncbi:MAG TPA: DUF3592 domain-containing protein [Terriglobia bacterium]|nr:DUF3592 domain-containing protein [Terriglobia bacterium]